MPYSANPHDLAVLLNEVLADPGLVKAREKTRFPEANLRTNLEGLAPKVLGARSREIDEFNQRETELKTVEADVALASKTPEWASGFGCLSIIAAITLVFTSRWSKQLFGIPARYFLAGLCAAAGLGFIALFFWQRHEAEERRERKEAEANLAARRDFVKKERGRLDKLLREQFLTEASTILAHLIEPSWATTLDYIRIGNLDQVWSVDTYVPTAALEEIDSWLNEARSASLGIAGPRGVGKSTLLQYLCGRKRNGHEDVQLLTSAPVDYDTRDFMLHLLAGLSRRILLMKQKDSSIDFTWEYVEQESQASISAFFRFSGLTGWLLLIVSTIAIVAGVLLQTLANQLANKASPPTPISTSPILLFGCGALVLALAAIAVSTTPRLEAMLRAKNIRAEELPPPFRPIASVIERVVERAIRRPPMDRSLALAQKTLGEVLYQRTYSGGWSGGLKIPVGIEAGTSRGISAAVIPQSLPELVYRFQSFVAKVTGEGGSVIVAIDELDKMPSDEMAQKFLNGIKIVFNIPRCYFLVSVSESALSSFERRGLPVRDVFDSSFDDVIRLRYLRPEGSRALLQPRVLALPEPFHCLCHCLSGGLPRDLVRIGKEMLPFTGKSMRYVAGRMIHHDVIEKLDAMQQEVQKNRQDAASAGLLTAIARVSGATRLEFPDQGVDLDNLVLDFGKLLLEGAMQITPIEGQSVLSPLNEQLRVYLYLSGTMVEFFTASRGENVWRHVSEQRGFDSLAQARQELGTNPAKAIARINGFRELCSMAQI
jgi:hypothetical protein